MSIKGNGGGSSTFVELARPFLQVIAHKALLNSLAIDTAVGGLYNFISGNNGTRAIPFFQRLCESLLDDQLGAGEPGSMLDFENNPHLSFNSATELLRHEPRTSFNDDLPALTDSIENIATEAGLDKESPAFHSLGREIKKLRGAIARAKCLLYQEEKGIRNGVSTKVTTSSYPTKVAFPANRFDNDKLDIVDISTLPTEDEIRFSGAEFLPTDLDQPHFLEDQAQRHIDTHFRLLHDIFR